MHELTLQEIKSMEVLHVGQYDNLIYEDEDTRVWISRLGLEDGEKFNSAVTVEKLINNRWQTEREYEAK